jgi:S1-C subfamily serine protease
MSPTVDRGVVGVRVLTPGAELAAAGVAAGDVITAINGYPMGQALSLRSGESTTRPVRTLVFEILRGNWHVVLAITPPLLPPAANERANRPSTGTSNGTRDSLSLCSGDPPA